MAAEDFWSASVLCDKCEKPVKATHSYEHSAASIAVISVLLWYYRLMGVPLFLGTMTYLMRHKFACGKCGKVAVEGGFFDVWVKERTLVLPDMCFSGVFLATAAIAIVYFQQTPEVQVTWKQYEQDCGKRAVFSDLEKAVESFTTNYHSHLVTWRGDSHTGQFVSIQNTDLLEPYKVCVQVAMTERDPIEADLNLCEEKEEVEGSNGWEVGEWLEFSGAFDHMGTSASGPFLTLHSVSPYNR